MAASRRPHDSLFNLAERITVADLVGDRKLLEVDAARPAAEVAIDLKGRDFDVAGVSATPIVRYLRAEEAEGDPRSVSELARPIPVERLTPVGLPVPEAIKALESHTELFVLGNGGVNSILTRADLQLPLVSLVTFGFVVALEAAIDRLIESAHGDDWKGLLSRDRLKEVEDLLTKRKRTNSEIGLLQCMNLDDRLTISEKTRAIWLNLGFSSRNQFCITAKRIKELRNLLAHGNDLLALDANPVEAIKVFVTIRDMAEKAWVVVQSE